MRFLPHELYNAQVNKTNKYLRSKSRNGWDGGSQTITIACQFRWKIKNSFIKIQRGPSNWNDLRDQ